MAPRSKLRPAPVAMTIALLDLWGRLSPAQRRQVLATLRRHGPKVVSKAASMTRRKPS
jgi:hypothetical protein